MKTLGKIVLWIGGSFICLVIIGMLMPAKHHPELLAVEVVGCQRQDAAAALARALATRGLNTTRMDKWAEQNGCNLVPAGSYVTAIEEAAGNSHVTKVSLNGDTMYLLGLPRPTSGERIDESVAGLKKALSGNK
jgi:hypothetical protein